MPMAAQTVVERPENEREHAERRLSEADTAVERGGMQPAPAAAGTAPLDMGADSWGEDIAWSPSAEYNNTTAATGITNGVPDAAVADAGTDREAAAAVSRAVDRLACLLEADALGAGSDAAAAAAEMRGGGAIDIVQMLHALHERVALLHAPAEMVAVGRKDAVAQVAALEVRACHP